MLVHDAKTAGKVFIELQKLGISHASISSVENSKIADYSREVIIAAIKAALEKAKELALAINQDIGRAIYVQEIENPGRDMVGSVSNKAIRGYSSSNIYGSKAAEPDIEFEKISGMTKMSCKSCNSCKSFQTCKTCKTFQTCKS